MFKKGKIPFKESIKMPKQNLDHPPPKILIPIIPEA